MNIMFGAVILIFLIWVGYFVSYGGYLKGEESILQSLQNESEVTYNNVTYGCKLISEKIK